MGNVLRRSLFTGIPINPRFVHQIQAYTQNLMVLILSFLSQDGSVRVWRLNTLKQESVLNYGLERCWGIAAMAHSNKFALGGHTA